MITSYYSQCFDFKLELSELYKTEHLLKNHLTFSVGVLQSYDSAYIIYLYGSDEIKDLYLDIRLPFQLSWCTQNTIDQNAFSQARYEVQKNSFLIPFNSLELLSDGAID